jgi:hypothetical protein
MTRWSLWLFVLSTCIACGAHSSNDPADALPGAGGNGGSAASGPSASGSDDSSVAGVGAAANPKGGNGSSSEGDSGGVTSDAGEPGYMPHIGSGTRNCEDANFCFGLSCYAPPSFEPTVCVARCETDWDCEPSETCVRSARLEPTCYARCDSPSDCAFHFDCVDFTGDGQAVCFPTSWAARREELGN